MTMTVMMAMKMTVMMVMTMIMTMTVMMTTMTMMTMITRKKKQKPYQTIPAEEHVHQVVNKEGLFFIFQCRGRFVGEHGSN